MDQFIQQLLTDKGIPQDLDEETKQQLVHDLSDRAADLINKRLVESMTPEAVEGLDKLLDENPDPVAAQNYISSNVPNAEQVTTQALLEFRALYLGANA